MILGLAVLVALFLLLLWQVQTAGRLVMLDGWVNQALAPLRRKPALSGFAWLTQMGTGAAGVLAAMVASGLFWSDGRTRLILPMWLTYCGAQATTWSLKFVAARARPPFIEGVTAASPSFPSAHATVSTATYGFLALAMAQGLAEDAQWFVYAAAVTLIGLIWFSRTVLSLHYLSDVAAGGVVGAAWLLLGWRFGHAAGGV